MKELVIEAVNDNLPEALTFVDKQLEAVSFPTETQMQIDLAKEHFDSRYEQRMYQ